MAYKKIFRNSKGAELLEDFSKRLTERSPQLNLLVWEQRSSGDFQHILKKKDGVNIDAISGTCLPAWILNEDRTQLDIKDTRNDSETSSAALRIEKMEAYKKLKYFSIFALPPTESKVRDLTFCLASSNQAYFSGKKTQKIASGLLQATINLLEAYFSISDHSDRKERLKKDLFKINSAEVAARHFHDIKDTLHNMDSPLDELGQKTRDARGKFDIHYSSSRSLLDSAKNLSSRFLEQAKDNRIKQERISLHKCLSKTISAFRIEAKSRGVIFRENAQYQACVSVDVYRISSVVSNVLSNSFYFTSRHAKSVGKLPEIEFSIEDASSEGYARIVVRDNGPGIENIDRAFEPGFSTRPKGSGLGLPMSRDVVRRHGGELSLTSSIGSGTIATVSLPLAGQGNG